MSDSFDDFLNHGLSRLTMGKLLANPSTLHDAVALKCKRVKQVSDEDRRLVGQVGIINDMVFRTLDCSNLPYRGLPVLVFAEFLTGLDYFLRLIDVCPDFEPHGYRDDFQMVKALTEQFKQEIQDYVRWKQNQV